MSYSETTIEPETNESNLFTIKGDLTLTQVVPLQKRSRRFWEKRSAVDVDLSGVGRADSAGLALIIEWSKNARKEGVEIRFFNPPDQLAAMARVSGLETVLPLYRQLPS
jgi:phospholipid transport system transporter-binding protein